MQINVMILLTDSGADAHATTKANRTVSIEVDDDNRRDSDAKLQHATHDDQPGAQWL